MLALKIVDFLLALSAAILTLFVGLERLRAYPELARLIDSADQRTNDLVERRATADVRAEAAAIARFAWRQVVWLIPVLLTANYLGIRAIAFAAAILTLIAVTVGGALELIALRRQFGRTMLVWWALTLATILFLVFANAENASGVDFVRGALLNPVGLHPESPSATALQALAVTSAAWLLFYIGALLFSGVIGWPIIGFLAGTRAAGAFARDRLDKKKLIALATLVTAVFAFLRAFVSLMK